WAMIFSNRPSSRNPVRILFSASLGNFGTRFTFGGVEYIPSRNIRFNAANSRFTVAFAAPCWRRSSTYLATKFTRDLRGFQMAKERLQMQLPPCLGILGALALI